MQKIYHKHVTLAELRPEVNAQGIFFPLSVENGKVPQEHEDDGLSFGYPVSHGNYAIVTFERAVGVLAEDTKAMFDEYQANKNNKENQVFLSEYFTHRTIPEWDKGLPPKTESEEQGGFYCWTAERQAAYKKAHYISSTQMNDEMKGELLYNVNNQQLWQCADGSWLRTPETHDDFLSGFINPVQLEVEYDWEVVKGILDSKIELLEKRNRMAAEIKDNLQKLSTVFGYKAA